MSKRVCNKILFTLVLVPTILYAGPMRFQSPSSTLAISARAVFSTKRNLSVSGGTIKKGKNAILEATGCLLKNGTYLEEEGTQVTATATLDTINQTITTANPGTTFMGGSVNQTQVYDGKLATLEGNQPVSNAQDTVRLANSQTVLGVALTAPLATSVALNGGTLRLDAELKLSGTGTTLIGDGTVNLNGRTLTLDGAPRSFGGKIVLQAASDLVFYDKITLTGEWTFSGDGVLSGNGNILDISQGGTLRIRKDTTVDMTNLKLKGLGLGKILFDTETSFLRLSNVEFEMNRDYSFSNGGIYAEGPTNIVTKNNKLIFSGTSSLSVDGIALTYDTLNNPDMYNIQPYMYGTASNSHITSLNGGILRNVLDGIQTFSNSLLYLTKNNSNALLFCCKNNSNALLFGDKNNSNTLLYLNKNNSNTLLYLNKNNSNALLFLAENNSHALLTCCRYNSNALLFGDRNNSNTLLYLNRTESNAMLFLTKNNSNGIVWLDTQLQTIDHGPLNITVTTDPFCMRFDVYLSHTHFMLIEVDTIIEGKGHKINLASKKDGVIRVAPGVTVEFQDVVFEDYHDTAFNLGADSNVIFGNCTMLKLGFMQQLQRPWVCTGMVQVRGYDNMLTVAPQSIEVLPGGQLSMHNVWLQGVEGSNIHCDDDNASLVLKDCNMCLSDVYSFTSGYMQFLQNVVISGGNSFIYATDVASTIDSCSSLYFDRTKFVYAPPVDNKDLIVLNDATSTLGLDSCDLEATTTGMRLTRGTLLANGKNNLINTGAVSPSQGFVFGNGNPSDDLNIQILPGGSLNLLSGAIDYQNVN